MNVSERTMEFLSKNNGYISAREAGQYGIDNKALQRLATKGVIERVARGLYLGIDYLPDAYYIAQYRCPKGIFSHDTALFFHDLSDRNPLVITMTLPSGGNSRLLSDKHFTFFYSNPESWSFALQKKYTAFNNEIVVYDMERTICDCIRSIDKLDRDLVLTAIKRYMKLESRDFVKLLAYADQFKVRDTVRKYIEVLV